MWQWLYLGWEGGVLGSSNSTLVYLCTDLTLGYNTPFPPKPEQISHVNAFSSVIIASKSECQVKYKGTFHPVKLLGRGFWHRELLGCGLLHFSSFGHFCSTVTFPDPWDPSAGEYEAVWSSRCCSDHCAISGRVNAPNHLPTWPSSPPTHLVHFASFESFPSVLIAFSALISYCGPIWSYRSSKGHRKGSGLLWSAAHPS